MDASIYIATSLDGFIAREDGGIDWLPVPDGSNGEDYGYDAFMATVDALVMGRNTFELVRTFDSWPYGKKPVVVLTSRSLDIPPKIAKTVETMKGAPADIVAALEARGMRHLYVDGGVTIQRFLAAGLIQRLIITRIPVLIGRGIPLFGDLPRDIRLAHVKTQQWPSGLVQSEYRVAASPVSA